jgi:DoxX-like family
MRDVGRASVFALRWVLSAVVLLQSVHFVLSRGAAQHLEQAALPLWVRPVLGWGEALAAVLFLVPSTIVVGGYGLLLTFMAAIAIHFREGDFAVGGLIVYGICVVVCLTHGESKSSRKAV